MNTEKLLVNADVFPDWRMCVPFSSYDCDLLAQCSGKLAIELRHWHRNITFDDDIDVSIRKCHDTFDGRERGKKKKKIKDEPKLKKERERERVQRMRGWRRFVNWKSHVSKRKNHWRHFWRSTVSWLEVLGSFVRCNTHSVAVLVHFEQCNKPTFFYIRTLCNNIQDHKHSGFHIYAHCTHHTNFHSYFHLMFTTHCPLEWSVQNKRSVNWPFIPFLNSDVVKLADRTLAHWQLFFKKSEKNHKVLKFYFNLFQMNIKFLQL